MNYTFLYKNIRKVFPKCLNNYIIEVSINQLYTYIFFLTKNITNNNIK